MFELIQKLTQAPSIGLYSHVGSLS